MYRLKHIGFYGIWLCLIAYGHFFGVRNFEVADVFFTLMMVSFITMCVTSGYEDPSEEELMEQRYKKAKKKYRKAKGTVIAYKCALNDMRKEG